MSPITGPYFNVKREGCAQVFYQNFSPDGYIDPSVQFKGDAKIGKGVIIEENCIIGHGCFIGHRAIIRPNTVMGDFSELRANAWLANDVVIGHHTVVYQYANISFGTLIGDYVYFGVRSTTTNASDIVLHRDRPFIPEPCVIEDGVRVATDTLLLPGVRLGRNCLIGAKALVTKNVPPFEKWMGLPAVKVGMVDPDDIPTDWRLP